MNRDYDLDDAFDGLGLCDVCGDRYTSPGETTCSECRRQQMIDEHDHDQTFPCKRCGYPAPWKGALCRDCYKKTSGKQVR
jgi:hypothetical protein